MVKSRDTEIPGHLQMEAVQVNPKSILANSFWETFSAGGKGMLDSLEAFNK